MIWQACGRRGSGNPQKGFDVAVFVKMGLRAGLQGVPGGAQEKKKSCGAPPPKKKQERRKKIRAGRGMEIKRKPVVPRRQRKSREEERKSEPGGAQGAKKALIPRLPSITRPA